MSLERILPFSKSLLKSFIPPNGTVIDATCGNGQDTVFLAEQVGAGGQVYGFDIQKAAIDKTRIRLEAARLDSRVTLFCASHQTMKEQIPAHIHRQISAVVFNLGYLPGGDHKITTLPDTTLDAVGQALELTKIGGLVLLVVYPGHEIGKRESESVLEFARQLPSDIYEVLQYGFINKKNAPPYILAIEKKGKKSGGINRQASLPNK